MNLFTVILTWSLANGAVTADAGICYASDSTNPALAAAQAYYDAEIMAGDWLPPDTRIVSARAIADQCDDSPSLGEAMHTSETPVYQRHVTIHWTSTEDTPETCIARMSCAGGQCEVFTAPYACTAPFGLEQCLNSRVMSPAGHYTDTLGCSPDATVLDVDWTPED